MDKKFKKNIVSLSREIERLDSDIKNRATFKLQL